MIAWLTDHPFIRKYGRGTVALFLLSALLGGLEVSYFTLAGETIPIAVVAKERLLKRYRTSKQETVEENGKTVKRSRRVTEYRYQYRVTIETGEQLWVEGPKRGDWPILETPFDRLKVGHRYRVLVAPKWRWFRRSIHRIEADLPTTQKTADSPTPIGMVPQGRSRQGWAVVIERHPEPVAAGAAGVGAKNFFVEQFL